LNVRDWLHVDDHCLGIELASEKGRAGEVYNIGGGTELSNLQLTKKILSKLGKDEGYIQYVEDRLGHDFRYSVDISKVEKELGFSPRVNWETGIESTINWYLENQSWWRKLKK
jgi:dTDP-glucose 4,6-dehydratase